MSAALALIAHDLKNALGTLESELVVMVDEPSADRAQMAHLHCADLRRQFVQFLTLYGVESEGLRALCDDESPQALLASLKRIWQRKVHLEGRAIDIRISEFAQPAYWYFDRRLVQMALDAAIQNAVRFAHSRVELSVRECLVREPQTDGSPTTWLVWAVTDDGGGFGADRPCEAATGLGTSLCEAVARVHGLGDRQGRIQLGPDPVEGTRFELWLP
jgi:signal transduction histidine kinase